MNTQLSNEQKVTAREKEIYKVTIVGSVVNLVLLLFKFFAGFVGHSAAMLADAVHSLSDFVTDVIVLVFVRLSSKPKDADHDYGYGKYETLATAIIGVCLCLVGLGILWNGVNSIWFVNQGGMLPQPGLLALIAALVSIVSKELLYHSIDLHVRMEGSEAHRKATLIENKLKERFGPHTYINIHVEPLK